MIKKLKIGLFVFAVLMFGFVGVQSANAAALHWDVDTTVTIGSTDYTIELDSEATEIVVGATTLTVTVPASSTFTLTSTNRYYFDTANASATRACTTDESTLTLTGATGAVIITPHTETLCDNGTGSGSSGRGGGSSTPATPAVPTVTPAVPATPVAGCSGGNLFNTSTGAACVNNAVIPQGCSGGNAFNTSTGAVCTNNAVLQIPGCGNRATGFSTATGGSCVGNPSTTTTTVTTTTTTTTTTSTYSFGTTTLKNGSKGEGVKELQRFLNAKLNLGLVVDGALGPKTIAVIKQWQSANGLVADGLVGAKTKAKMNAQ